MAVRDPHDHDHAHAHAHDHDHAHHGGVRAQAHDHAHAHAHHHAIGGTAFGLGLALNVAYVGVEVVAGLVAGSLALIADAAHNLVDALALLAAWVATVLARRAPTARRTYGLRRSTILAALGNSVLLLIAVGGIAWEAVRRLSAPQHVETGIVAWVAGVGVAINLGTAALFWRGSHADLNARAAFLHMLGDAALTVGVVLAALGLRLTGWLWLDPALSLVIVAVIAVTSVGVLRQSLDLALDAVPAHIEPADVRAYLAALPAVRDVHDLHIWGMSTTEVALTAHLVVASPGFDDERLAALGRDLRSRFGIAHATVQVERGDPAHPCGLAEDGAV